ncbi:hypothetical protein ES677_09160 [Bizionia gelidisalsuginis]|uniref:Uncharacterized protein n=2 Tax=Bizionia TaxID=283785 RepID=A0A8H2QGB6_9FLAO|nr:MULTISPECIES: hypothetical protein [Bizionia]TYB78090.1 hypothetical protein ES676_02430 [Bizionia saleffrena]TYC12132.1 hypothetical protein ES677_09160 [Bizionia gelidisalsuginis]
MNKKEILLGFVIGLVTTTIGVIIYTIFIGMQVGLNSDQIIDKITSTTVLGKRASIGVLLNLPVFYLFLNRKKEDIAKGVLAAIVVVALIFILNKF